MYRYDNIYLLVAAIVAFILIILFKINKKWRDNSIKKIVDKNLFKKVFPDFSLSRIRWKNILSFTGIILIIFSLGRPRWGSKEQEVKKEGIDIIVALDVSNSMLAQDLSPNRLERAKLALLQLIKKLKNDRLGIIVFGGQAYVQLPLTTDYSAAKLFINTINTKLIPTQGTAIGAAIDLGIESFNTKSPTQKAIIIITDGENHEDDAAKLAQLAAEKGIFVYTIGMGSEQGAPIPISGNNNNANSGNFKKDREGNTVITRLNENMLSEIATNGKGIFVRASNANSGLDAVMNELEKLEKTEFGSTVFIDYDDYYQYFLVIGIILLLIDFSMSNKSSKLLKKINLFSSEQS